jgi:hypothetical protein
MDARADRVNEIERQRFRWAALSALQARIGRLRAGQKEEREDFERVWDRRLEAMRAQMKSEITPKSTALAMSRSGRSAGTAPVPKRPFSGIPPGY